MTASDLLPNEEVHLLITGATTCEVTAFILHLRNKCRLQNYDFLRSDTSSNKDIFIIGFVLRRRIKMWEHQNKKY